MLKGVVGLAVFVFVFAAGGGFPPGTPGAGNPPPLPRRTALLLLRRAS